MNNTVSSATVPCNQYNYMTGDTIIKKPSVCSSLTIIIGTGETSFPSVKDFSGLLGICGSHMYIMYQTAFTACVHYNCMHERDYLVTICTGSPGKFQNPIQMSEMTAMQRWAVLQSQCPLTLKSPRSSLSQPSLRLQCQRVAIQRKGCMLLI